MKQNRITPPNFNIEANYIQSFTQFLGISELPDPPATVPKEVLENELRNESVVDENAMEFFLQMEAADQRLPTKPFSKAFTLDFVATILRLAGYTSGRYLLSRMPLRFKMDDKTAKYKAGMALANVYQEIVLLVEDDLALYGLLFCKAMAAFEENNLSRDLRGLDPLERQLIPAIVMIKTSSLFFCKILITQDQVDAAHSGRCPATPPVVEILLPQVPNVDKCEGITSLKNRLIYFRLLEAFKQFLV